ncbi:hypothetical protein BWI93_03535 [Siphonobacter sp. BAB-5385]|uniref:hypothetical protein n=1 Tax=unclassified Siphonobacter TaxID=2635712 RepID=UPI000B9EADDC|nr:MULTISPECIES: hypothetical protein [unclassified Siphonobacter]OZI09547.1 hypothetical protein BWI93_03535 [Siphonobacter sp. BAB-5385]PMD93779.1 hypothetical protein BWI97_17720 [Siphonobacter sp. BAB-5405]
MKLIPKLGLWILLTVSTSVYAQSDTVWNQYLRIQPLQLLCRELVVEYEFPVTEKLTIGLGAGYRFRKSSGTSEVADLMRIMTADYRLQNMANPYYQGVKFSLSPRYYLDTRKSFYVSAELFMRYWWLNRLDEQYLNPKGTYVRARKSEEMDVWGGKILVGLNRKLVSFSAHQAVYITPFLGIGFRHKAYTYQRIYLSSLASDTGDNERGGMNLAGLHGGFSLAYRWAR